MEYGSLWGHSGNSVSFGLGKTSNGRKFAAAEDPSRCEGRRNYGTWEWSLTVEWSLPVV